MAAGEDRNNTLSPAKGNINGDVLPSPVQCTQHSRNACQKKGKLKEFLCFFLIGGKGLKHYNVKWLFLRTEENKGD